MSVGWINLRNLHPDRHCRQARCRLVHCWKRWWCCCRWWVPDSIPGAVLDSAGFPASEASQTSGCPAVQESWSPLTVKKFPLRCKVHVKFTILLNKPLALRIVGVISILLYLMDTISRSLRKLNVQINLKFQLHYCLTMQQFLRFELKFWENTKKEDKTKIEKIKKKM